MIIWIDKITRQFFKMDKEPTGEDLLNFDYKEIEDFEFEKLEKLKESKILIYDGKDFKEIDNEITREELIYNLKKELEKLKTEYSEKTFIFKEKYLQKNRELDKNNLGNIVTFMTVSKQTHFKDWKFKDLEDNDVYVDLTLHDMLEIALIMQEQTTKAMKIETTLNEKVKILLDEELKTFNVEREFEDMWNGTTQN